MLHFNAELMQLQDDQLREHEEEDQVIRLVAKSPRSSQSLNDVITDLIANTKRSKKSKPAKSKRPKKTVSKKKKKNKKNYDKVLSLKKSNHIEKGNAKNNQDEVDLNSQLLQKLIYLNSLNLINNQAVTTSPPPPPPPLNNYADLSQNAYGQANYKPHAPFNPTVNNENIPVQESGEQEDQILNLRHSSYRRPKESKAVYRTYLDEDDYDLNDWDEPNVIDLRSGDYFGKPKPTSYNKKSAHGSYSKASQTQSNDGEFVVDLRASNAKSQRRANYRDGKEIVIKLII